MAKRSGPSPYPFLKWAGGKRQILPDLEARFPPEIRDGKITRYIEPFLGGGAVLLHILSNYGAMETFLSDLNPDLCLAWKVVRDYPDDLIDVLSPLAQEYGGLDPLGQYTVYYSVREAFNSKLPGNRLPSTSGTEDEVTRVARLIFLNRTCFNGLYRVNSQGGFNVPFGKYKRPTILDETNIRAVSALLSTSHIQCADFSCSREIPGHGSFVYLDPPYRPISQTASFTSYASSGFSDREQTRLAGLFRELDRRGARVMLSNSDPRNYNPHDDFFDQLYEGFRIDRVPARRYINSNGSGRGHVQEIIVTNY